VLEAECPAVEEPLSRRVVGYDLADWPRFVQSRFFTKEWDRLGLDDEDLRALELLLMAAPDQPPVIPGTGGLRKIRFAKRGSGRGKSSSYRTCYVYFFEHNLIYLLLVYGKGEKTDLTAAERRMIARIIDEVREDIKTWGARR
jgi:hypothetical protein